MEFINIQFIDPKSVGFKDEDFNNKEECEIIVARVGLMQFQIDAVTMIHYVIKTNNNECLMKSRFWVGHEPKAHKTIPIPLRWIWQTLIQFPTMKKVMKP